MNGETGGKKPATEAKEIPSSRRRFLSKLLIVLGAAAVAEAVVVVTTFLKPRKERESDSEFGGLFEAGAVNAFETGTVTAFARGHFFLARLEDGGFLAFSRRCTHLGCTVTWDSEAKRFLCPCHASSFDILGNVLSTPAPRALDLFQVRIENDIIRVDTGKAVQRKRFRASQVVRPQAPKDWVRSR
jgi:cytochrome b6-f complex iron-sulfur subunit